MVLPPFEFNGAITDSFTYLTTWLSVQSSLMPQNGVNVWKWVYWRCNTAFMLTKGLKLKVKVWTLATAPLTWVRLVTSSALQSRKWQLIGMSQWCRSADNWTHGAASRHTIAPNSHTRPSPIGYYSFPILLRVGGWVCCNLPWSWVGSRHLTSTEHVYTRWCVLCLFTIMLN